MKWRIFIMSFIITINSIAMAQQWEESYDPNTEIAIKGKIIEVMERQHGMLVIGIIKNNRIYRVITAPKWYVDEKKIELKSGEEVVVYGAKFFSKKGELFLIARSIQIISTNQTHTFRDEFMKPCWRGRGRGRFTPPEFIN